MRAIKGTVGTIAVGALLLALGACHDVIDLDEDRGDTPDTAADGDVDSDGDADAIVDGWPVPLQRVGQLGIWGSASDRVYAVSDDCDLHQFDGAAWTLVHDFPYTSDPPDEEFPVQCFGLWVAQDAPEIFSAGAMPWSTPIYHAGVTHYEEADLPLEGSVTTHGCVPTGLSEPDGACEPSLVDPEHWAFAGWFESVWGIDATHMIVVGGYAYSTGGGIASGGSGVDGFTAPFNPNSGLLGIRDEAGWQWHGHPDVPDHPLTDVWGADLEAFHVTGWRISWDTVGESVDDIYVHGKVYLCNQASCAEEHTVPGMYLTGIWGASTSNVWAVGGYWHNGDGGGNLGAVILHRDSDGWSEVAAPTDVPLQDVWGSAADDVYAVGGYMTGASSVVLHFDGSAWTVLKTDATGPLYGVWGSGPDDVHIVGQDGFFHIGG